MKLIELRAENVKRLKAARVAFGDSMTVIGGKNGAGKSSVLDAIMYALAGASTLPGKPVRNGADKATIELDLEGTPNLVVRRKITAEGRTTLEIEQKNDDGSKAKIASPQKLLDSLVSSVAFDPLAFTRLRPQEQVESLRAAVGVSVDDLDAKIRQLFDERTAVNRDVKQVESQLAGMPAFSGLPDAPIDPAEIIAEADAVNARNRQRDDAKNALAMAQHNAEHAASLVERHETEIAEAQKKLDSLVAARSSVKDVADDRNTKAKAAKDALDALGPMEDSSAVAAKLGEVNAKNEQIRMNVARSEKADRLKAAQDQATDLSKQIDQLRQDRIDRLAGAEWPVDGLGFTDSGVTFNDLPFDQCSSAEQLRISTAIALAQNPKLPLGFIKDGSLLDADSLAMIEELAASRGAQIIVERVGNGAECSVVIEDGEVLDAAAVA